MSDKEIHYAKIGKGEALFTCAPEDAPEVRAKLEAIMKKREAELRRDMEASMKGVSDA